MVAGPRLFRGDPMTSVPALFALQELDLALADSRKALADVDSLLGDSGPLEEAQEHDAKQRELLRAAEKHSMELEYEADEQRRKIEPVEAKLYEGKVTIPKELEDLQMDLESLQRRRSELDDRALEAMEALDEAGRMVAESEQALQRAEAAYNGDQEELGARKAVLQSEIGDLEGRRTDAAELIEVDYDPLPAIISTEDAPQPGAPLVWDDCPDNICYYHQQGDAAAVDAAIAGAEHVVRKRLVVNRVTAVSMEPRGCLGDYNPRTGRYTLYCGLQNPHPVRDQLARLIFHEPETNFRIVQGDVGGSFGMKGGTYHELPLVLWASRKCGRPVKWMCERSEGFMSDDHARDNVTDVTLGDPRRRLAQEGHFPVGRGAAESGAALAADLDHAIRRRQLHGDRLLTGNDSNTRVGTLLDELVRDAHGKHVAHHVGCLLGQQFVQPRVDLGDSEVPGELVASR